MPPEAFDNDVEVRDRTVLSVVDDALARFSEAHRATAPDAPAANGPDDPSAQEWYPRQAWPDTFEMIAAVLEPHVLSRLGERIPDVAEWLPSPSTVEGVSDPSTTHTGVITVAATSDSTGLSRPVTARLR